MTPGRAMASQAGAARVPDVIDVAPAFTPAEVEAYATRYAGVDTAARVAGVLADLAGRVAAVSSFGAESAVLLHLIAQVDKAVPVIFVNTQKMFGETLAYRDALAERLGLTNLSVHRPNPHRLAVRDATSLRWSFDPDGCCDIRKVEPLRRALVPFDAWLSGRKGFQAATRAMLPVFELDEGKLKINPLADWDKARLDAYFTAHDLPRHPLEAKGFASVGCVPCTTSVRPGEDPRAGRWRGWDKTECGIHVPGPHDPAF
jgi:phosphoadenosine phosphosulfate reductase